MIKTKNIIIALFIALMMSLQVPKAEANVGFPTPFAPFSGIYSAFDPMCLNGAIVIVFISLYPPVPLILLYPYFPISPIQPVGKLWGPIPGASTEGAFLPGGVCYTKESGGFVSFPVEGTLQQIGTTAAPTPWYIPTLFPAI